MSTTGAARLLHIVGSGLVASYFPSPAWSACSVRLAAKVSLDWLHDSNRSPGPFGVVLNGKDVVVGPEQRIQLKFPCPLSAAGR